MTARALHAIGGYLFAGLVLWLVGGFVAMDWDVRDWSEGGRLSLAYLSLIGGVLGLSA
jgi:hypothetical protein